jgi:hypothetical protein
VGVRGGVKSLSGSGAAAWRRLKTVPLWRIRMAEDRKRTTVLFRTYYQKQSAGGKEEGVIRITDERGKLTDDLPDEHFNSFDEIPKLMRKPLEKRVVSAL